MTTKWIVLFNCKWQARSSITTNLTKPDSWRNLNITYLLLLFYFLSVITALVLTVYYIVSGLCCNWSAMYILSSWVYDLLDCLNKLSSLISNNVSCRERLPIQLTWLYPGTLRSWSCFFPDTSNQKSKISRFSNYEFLHCVLVHQHAIVVI